MMKITGYLKGYYHEFYIIRDTHRDFEGAFGFCNFYTTRKKNNVRFHKISIFG